MRSRGVWRLRAPIAGAIAVAIAVLGVLAGCADRGPAGTAPSSRPVPAVQAKVFVPVTTAAGRAVSGSCWTGSITVGSPSAYRCYAGDQILDPCFAASPSAHAVACYADPWTAGVRVALTAALPTTPPLLITHPWALELANGKHCVTATGVVARIGTLALVYRCHGGGSTGAPSDGAQTRVRYVAPGSHRPVPVAVTVIWQV